VRAPQKQRAGKKPQLPTRRGGMAIEMRRWRQTDGSIKLLVPQATTTPCLTYADSQQSLSLPRGRLPLLVPISTASRKSGHSLTEQPTSGLCSTDKSVRYERRCQRSYVLSFHGLWSPSRSLDFRLASSSPYRYDDSVLGSAEAAPFTAISLPQFTSKTEAFVAAWEPTEACSRCGTSHQRIGLRSAWRVCPEVLLAICLP